jgi:16S rRNA (uracil1498-N3)-methyltransferase
MNIILAEAAECRDKRLVVDDRRAEHMVKVLHVVPGDVLRVGIINGRRGRGRVLSLAGKYPFSVTLALEWEEAMPDLPFLDLILALPRPIMLKRIFSQVAALGVGTIHLVHANRVEKSFWEAGILQPHEYRNHLLIGLEQAVDTRLPEVLIHPRFKPFVEDFCPTLAGPESLRLVADPNGDRPLAKTPFPANGRVLLAVGPEGGWVPYELEKFRQQGFLCVSFGTRILKVDTAIVALHAAVTALRLQGSE